MRVYNILGLAIDKIKKIPHYITPHLFAIRI